MVEFLASDIQVIEEQPGVRTLPDLPTAVPGFVGIAERGPLDTPTTVASFDDYLRVFGGFLITSEMTLAVRQFFLNGGRQAVIVRVLEGTPVAATLSLLTAASGATAGSALGTIVGPYVFVAGDTLVVNVDATGNATATFDAAPAVVTGANAETFALSDGDSMSFVVEGVTKTVTFNTGEFADIANATAAEVAAVINAEATGISVDVDTGAVRITSDLSGTDSALGTFADVSGTPVAVLGFTGLSDTGTGDVANIASVTVAEIKTVVEADISGGSGVTVNDVGGAVQIVSNTTGPASSIAVDATSTADGKIGIDNATHSGTTGAPVATLIATATSVGTWGNAVSLRVDPPSSGVVTGVGAQFNLIVVQDGVDEESFSNVSMDPTALDYVETAVNDALLGSNLITIADQLVGITPPDNRPTTGTFPMIGGLDGDPVIDSTFTGGGDPLAGMNSLEAANITLLAIPDRATVVVQNAMVTFAEVTRNGLVFLVLDPPAGADVPTIRAHKAALPISEQYALYWPRIKIANPDAEVFGSDAEIVSAPAGSIIGMMARNDAAKLEGAFAQPAGTEEGRLFSVTGVENDAVFRKSNRNLIFPERINPITKLLSGGGIFVDGARTGKQNGNFPSVGERRGVSFVESTLTEGSQFVRHKNNTETLRATLDRTTKGFLRAQTSNGAFASTNPALAFLVDTDIPGTGINNASVRAQGKLFQRIGLATAKPAEHVIFLVSQDTRALQEAS